MKICFLDDICEYVRPSWIIELRRRQGCGGPRREAYLQSTEYHIILDLTYDTYDTWEFACIRDTFNWMRLLSHLLSYPLGLYSTRPLLHNNT